MRQPFCQPGRAVLSENRKWSEIYTSLLKGGSLGDLRGVNGLFTPGVPVLMTGFYMAFVYEESADYPLQ